MTPIAAKSVRCAIYTRKSSDEGLEQDFNSLDAQREACAAYVLSQASEGWTLLPEPYDDGGLSGGTLERPALQRLLEQVEAGRIDIIVVYKVDRLTRSLLDFARLVEAFDAAGTCFVSVTQSFNTTTSMGRLTLNMLLSFAQFEREVTAERIRDKIAASKARGMWMGGTPPLGYRADGRSLAIIEEHAAIIRHIYARYLALGNVRLVAQSLADDNIRTPRRTNGKGRCFGGCAFTRGQLYAILQRPIYAGDIPHKDKVYPGNHAAIIERDVWEAVQRQLADNVKGLRTTRQANASLLAGLLFDPAGEPIIPVHTNKGKQRYRYYVRKSDQHGTASHLSPSLRLPAREIEQVVRQALAALLADPMALIARCELDMVPAMLGSITEQCAAMQAALTRSAAPIVRALITCITVHPDRLDMTLSPHGLGAQLDIATGTDTPTAIRHSLAVRLTRTGRAVRLIHDNGIGVGPLAPDATLIKLVTKAQRWWSVLAKGECDIAELSRREQVTASYMTRLIRLAFLAPDIVEAITTGNIRAGVDGAKLLATGAIAADWGEQRVALLADAQS